MFKPEKNPVISTGPNLRSSGPLPFPEGYRICTPFLRGTDRHRRGIRRIPRFRITLRSLRCNDISSLFLQVDFPFFIHARFYMRSRSEKLPHKDCRQQDPKDRNPPLFIEGKTIPFCRETERKKSFFHKSPFYLHHRL